MCIITVEYFKIQHHNSLTADRAKQIKTSAKVNEDPTEKLIRELKEENDKLMEMLKKAQAGESVKISADDDDDDGEKEGLSEEEMAELRKQIEEEIKASMAQTEQETQDMNKSWDDRVAENKKDIKVEKLTVLYIRFFK